MVSLALLSTVLMGLLVVATLITIGRVGTRRTPPAAQPEGDRYDVTVARLSEIARNPTTWTVSFVLLTVVVTALVLLGAGGFGFGEELAGTLYSISLAALGLLIAGFVFLGAYFGARGRGLGNAHGIAAGSLALGSLFLVLLAAQLLFGVVG